MRRFKSTPATKTSKSSSGKFPLNTDYKEYLKTPKIFLKFPYSSRSVPKLKNVCCKSGKRGDCGTLTWTAAQKKSRRSVRTVSGKEDKVSLAKLRAVYFGKQTKAFKNSKHAKSVDAALCFSLIFPERSLDFQTDSEFNRNYYVTALRHMLLSFAREDQENVPQFFNTPEKVMGVWEKQNTSRKT